jgi:hypothetical protein
MTISSRLSSRAVVNNPTVCGAVGWYDEPMKRQYLVNNLARRLSIGVLVISGIMQLGSIWLHHKATRKK